MIGPMEILVIAGVFVLLFGASRLPKLARGMGSSVSEFKKGLAEAKSLRDEVLDARLGEDVKELKP